MTAKQTFQYAGGIEELFSYPMRLNGVSMIIALDATDRIGGLFYCRELDQTFAAAASGRIRILTTFGRPAAR